MDILLVYAVADGHEPATRLADLLRTMGATVFDVAAAAPQGAGVIVLLTPTALGDRSVLAALQNAPASGRPLLPLSVQDPVGFPAAEDLVSIVRWWQQASAPGAGAKYVVHKAIGSAIGDNATIINVGSSSGHEAEVLLHLAELLSSGRVGSRGPQVQQDLRSLMQAQLQQYRQNLAQLELQVAQHGGEMHAPMALLNQVSATQASIKRLEQELDRMARAAP